MRLSGEGEGEGGADGSFGLAGWYLLGVGGPFHLGKLRLGVGGAQEYGLKLVHAGVCKQQGGVCMGHHTAAGHHCVPLALEKLYEGGPHPISCRDDPRV